MILARVLGTAVSTVKHASYQGRTVLFCESVNPRTNACDPASFLAVDSVQAGVGDLVLVAREGNAARQVLGSEEEPLHSVVLGIVDGLELAGEWGGRGA